MSSCAAQANITATVVVGVVCVEILGHKLCSVLRTITVPISSAPVDLAPINRTLAAHGPSSDSMRLYAPDQVHAAIPAVAVHA